MKSPYFHFKISLQLKKALHLKKLLGSVNFFLKIIIVMYFIQSWFFTLKSFEKKIKKRNRSPKKHGNSVTNSISSLLWISIAIPNFKSHNIIMSARVYFMKRVNDCKDVSIMSPQDEKWRRTSLFCLYTAIFLFY